jgi:histidyl-tRNA synthetase
VASDEIDDAAPLEAVKWSFVRRRVNSLFWAHGYREVSPPPLELRGTQLMARRTAAWPVGDDLELRADPIVSLAQLYTRARRAELGAAPLVRWVLSDVVFDPGADGETHRYPAWHAIAGALFGVEGIAAELEACLLAHRMGVDLGLSHPNLRIALPADPARASALRASLEQLRVAHELLPEAESFVVELLAHPVDGPALVVLRGRREDALLSALGDPPAPLFGLVASVRRAASCTPGGAETFEAACEVLFLAEDDDGRVRALGAAARERTRGLRVEVELRDLPREERLERARALRARVIVEFGAARETARVRTAEDAEGHEVSLGELSTALRRLLR